MKYAVITEKGPTSYVAYEETETLIPEAVGLHLELMREHGDPIPEPTTTTSLVEA